MNMMFGCTIAVFVAMGVHNVLAAPRHRVKRMSDAHLADIISKYALNNGKIQGVVIRLPVGGGRVDPSRAGRRRRSQSTFLDVLFNQLEEDQGDPTELSDYDSLMQRFRSFE